MLLDCNGFKLKVSGLYAHAFLPTMKFQLSQLPMIVGSGRVTSRRALFSWPHHSVAVLIQALEALH
jgi:hypothetical protein